jgi:hypothetical protein
MIVATSVGGSKALRGSGEESVCGPPEGVVEHQTHAKHAASSLANSAKQLWSVPKRSLA